MGKILDENGMPKKGYPQKVLNLVPISVDEILKGEMSKENRDFLMSEEGSKIQWARDIKDMPTYLQKGILSNRQIEE